MNPRVSLDAGLPLNFNPLCGRGNLRGSARGGDCIRLKGRLAVVTDGYCASACLDFMDGILLHPSTVHLGRTTSADTRYMDVDDYTIRDDRSVVIPRKAWFGRPRGHNQPYVPKYRFDGDIGDDDAVRAWVIRTLETAPAA